MILKTQYSNAIFLSFRHLKHEQTSLTFVNVVIYLLFREVVDYHLVDTLCIVITWLKGVSLFFLLLSFHLSAIINADTK